MTLPEHMFRMTRLLDEIQYLRANEMVTVPELAKQFSISPERIITDLQDLSHAGVPVVMSSSGCAILPAFDESAGWFELDEICHLLQSLQSWYHQGSITEEKYLSIQNKLLSGLPANVMHHIRKIQQPLSHPKPVKNAVNPKCMNFMQSALMNHQRVKMRYQSRQDTRAVWREISPYSMVYRKDTWYIIGYCHRREEVRTFKLNRIHDYDLSKMDFHLNAGFDLQDYLLYTWNIIGGEPQLVIIRFCGEARTLILEKQISNGRVWKESGYVYLKTIVAGLDEIGWWVIQYGEMAEVLQPQALRDWLKTRAVKMANLYKKTGNPKHHGNKVISLFK